MDSLTDEIVSYDATLTKPIGRHAFAKDDAVATHAGFCLNQPRRLTKGGAVAEDIDQQHGAASGVDPAALGLALGAAAGLSGPLS